MLREEPGAVTDRAGIYEITRKTKTARSKSRPVGVCVAAAFVDFVVLGSAVSKIEFSIKTAYICIAEGNPVGSRALFAKEA